MACEHEVFDKKSRTWRPCTRSATLFAESLIDGEVTRMCCCKQHYPALLRRIVSADPYQFGHGKRNRLHSETINTHLVVKSRKETPIERVHLGTVHFGPETEMEYLDRMYDHYHDEYCLIGMYRLQHEYDDWRDKYNECAYHMRCIESRMREIEA